MNSCYVEMKNKNNQWVKVIEITKNDINRFKHLLISRSFPYRITFFGKVVFKNV